ncbi:MAG: MarR family transcriptional regulator [Acidobacteriota bacterium]
MTKSTFRVFHLLQRAHGALFRAADKFLRHAEGLTAAQHGVLLVLSTDDGVPISTIAEELRMGKSSLTGLVDRMSKTGLVRRAPCPVDGRVTRIHLEPAGRRLIGRTVGRIKAQNEALLEPFSDAERDTIRRFLLHITEHADGLVGDVESRETVGVTSDSA